MKFRIWCYNKNEWERDTTVLLPNGTLFDLNHHKTVSSETHGIERFFGILDVHGNELYENDIVEYEGIRAIVRYGMCGNPDGGYIGFYLQFTSENEIINKSYRNDICFWVKGLKKVGNIHEV